MCVTKPVDGIVLCVFPFHCVFAVLLLLSQVNSNYKTTQRKNYNNCNRWFFPPLFSPASVFYRCCCCLGRRWFIAILERTKKKCDMGNILCFVSFLICDPISLLSLSLSLSLFLLLGFPSVVCPTSCLFSSFSLGWSGRRRKSRSRRRKWKWKRGKRRNLCGASYIQSVPASTAAPRPKFLFCCLFLLLPLLFFSRDVCVYGDGVSLPQPLTSCVLLQLLLLHVLLTAQRFLSLSLSLSLTHTYTQSQATISLLSHLSSLLEKKRESPLVEFPFPKVFLHFGKKFLAWKRQVRWLDWVWKMH